MCETPASPSGIDAAAAPAEDAALARAEAVLAQVADTIGRFRYLFATESALRDQMAARLARPAWVIAVERRYGVRNRVDIEVTAEGVRVAIEVKTAGSLGAAVMQCERYAALPEVDAVLLVSAAPWAGGAAARSWRRLGGVVDGRGGETDGKPFRVLRAAARFF